MTQHEWALDLVEDFEVPGWLFIPGGLDPGQSDEWVLAATEEVADKEGWDGSPISRAEADELLRSALSDRDNTSSIATFQVWPPIGRVTAMCHIGVYPCLDMPKWVETDAIVHRFEAPHIGPGLQCTTQRVISNAAGADIDLAGIHFVFDDGEATLIVSLAEAFEPLTVYALRGVLPLLRNLRLVRPGNGQTFQSVMVEGVLEESPWQFEESV